MKTRKKTSVIWKIDRNTLKELTQKSTTIRQILNYFGLSSKGGNYKTLRRRLDHEGIDHSHIPMGRGSNKGRRFSGDALSLNMIMIENSTYNPGHLKPRLIQSGLLEERCYICSLEPMWNGQSLVFRLDHINGINNDNRLENLRLLCPNCDSQTSTFAGRNHKRADSSIG